MIEKIKTNTLVFWLLSAITISLTGLFTVIDFYEYYNVAIKKDIAGYPFGAEGPVAGFEYFKTADLYAKHVLTTGIISSVLLILTVYFVIKRKTLGLLIIMSLLISYMLYNIIIAYNN